VSILNPNQNVIANNDLVIENNQTNEANLTTIDSHYNTIRKMRRLSPKSIRFTSDNSNNSKANFDLATSKTVLQKTNQTQF
jgi:hypothetical protein